MFNTRFLRYLFPVMLISGSLCLAGCRSTDAQARQAYSDYQAAVASNDLAAARKALLKLVNVQDSVPENWTELGRLQERMGAYGDARYAYTRAYELNRGNVDILRAMTRLSLFNGDFAGAQTHARELEVVAPTDGWIKLADGYAALSQSRYEEVLAASDAMLAVSPQDSNAKVLKARALLAQSKTDEALTLLTEQLAAQPNDLVPLQLTGKIFEQRKDWPRVAETARRLVALQPDKQDSLFVLITALFKAGRTQEARETSIRNLSSGANPATIASIMDLWLNYWPSPQRATDALSLGRSAPQAAQKLAYATFLNRVGNPAAALTLIGLSAKLPVTAGTVDADAVFAESLLRAGKVGEASRWLDAVLAYDSGNVIALRSRAELRLATKRPIDAVPDAQKLVSVVPTSAEARLLLARCYTAAGNAALAERALWDGFHEIPNSDLLFDALNKRAYGNSEAVARLSEEYSQQRNAELYRGFL